MNDHYTDSSTLWLTGASSQLGVALLLHLQESHTPVTAITHRSSAPVDYPGFTHRTVDLRDMEAFSSWNGCTTLIHTAPLWLLPAHIPRLAKAGCQRIIAFGSTSIMGKENSEDAHEQEVIRLLTEAEATIARLCQQAEIAWTILRPTMIYGLGMDRNITLIRSFVERYGFFPILPPASGLRQPVHAGDLAMAVVQCHSNESAFNKAYNVSGGETLPYRAMLERIFVALEKSPRLLASRHLPRLLRIYARLTGSSLNAEMAHRMNQDLVFDHSDAHADFGYTPRAFLAGGKADLFLPA